VASDADNVRVAWATFGAARAHCWCPPSRGRHGRRSFAPCAGDIRTLASSFFVLVASLLGPRHLESLQNIGRLRSFTWEALSHAKEAHTVYFCTPTTWNPRCILLYYRARTISLDHRAPHAGTHMDPSHLPRLGMPHRGCVCRPQAPV
jgi:hypothetical protein